jgi:hypothetical protein
MDSCLQDFVNDLDALGIAGTGSIWDDFFKNLILIFKPLGVTQQLIDGLMFVRFCE